MRQIIIFMGLGLVLVGGIYVFLPTVETASAMVLMARDIFFPSDDNNKKAVGVPGVGSRPKPTNLSGFAAKFSNSLMIMDDGTPQSFDTAKLEGVKYYAFYYSASWCPPCRTFTPDLVSFYRSFKPFHREFELIFVDLDHNQDDMLNYMRSDSMRWPAVWYADIDNSEIEAKKYCGPGIPCLVLVDDKGRVLSDTFVNGQYSDPHKVIDDIRAAMP
jgi:nucleoredoxin